MSQFPKIFRFLTQLITLFSFVTLVSPVSYGAAILKLTPSELAERTAKAINHYGTVGEYVVALENHFTKAELKRTVKMLNKMGITEKTSMIKVKVDANKVYFDKNNYMIYNTDGTVTISGHVFKQDQKGPYDVVFAKVMKKTSGNKSAALNLLIPEAHAFDWGGLLNFALIGALIGGGIFALKSIFSGGLFGGGDDDAEVYERPPAPVQ